MYYGVILNQSNVIISRLFVSKKWFYIFPKRFIVGGGMEHWKALSTTMVGRQEKFSNSRRSRMVKTKIFWSWWQLFNSFCFDILSFFTLSPFFVFATQKSGGKRGGGSIAPRPPRCRRPWWSLTNFVRVFLYSVFKKLL